MPKLKPIKKEQEIFTAGIARDRALFASTKLKTILSKSAILFLVLLIASLSTLVFSRTSFWTANNVNLSIDSDFTLFVDVTNNRIGINTSDPTATLQVNGSVRVVPLASCNTIDTDANGLMSCGTDDAGGGASPWANSSEYIFTNDTFPKAVNLSNTLFVNGSSGRVGIGTRNPAQELNVVGSVNATTALIVGTTPASTGDIRIPYDSWIAARNTDGSGDINMIRIGTGGRNDIMFSGSPVTFGAGGIYNMNYVSMPSGVGDSAPGSITGLRTANLFLVGNADGTNANSVIIQTQNAVTAGTAGNTTRLTFEGGSATTNTYFQNTNVGIGTTSPGSARLNVSGNISVTGHPNNTGIIFADGSLQTKAGMPKEFFAPVSAWLVAATNSYEALENVGGEWALSGPLDQAGVGERAWTVFYVPSDFKSIIQANLVFRPQSTGTSDIDITTNYASVNESSTQQQQNITRISEVTSGEIEEVDISAALSNVTAGDYVGVGAEFGATVTIRVLGVRFKYG